MRPLLSFNLHHDQDVVTARRQAAEIAALLEFDLPDQTRIATAVSEIARNALRYAGGGWVEFAVTLDARPQRLVIHVHDDGPGVEKLDEVLSGQYKSLTGLGRGIMGARRLMDGFSISPPLTAPTSPSKRTCPREAPSSRVTASVRSPRPCCSGPRRA